MIRFFTACAALALVLGSNVTQSADHRERGAVAGAIEEQPGNAARACAAGLPDSDFSVALYEDANRAGYRIGNNAHCPDYFYVIGQTGRIDTRFYQRSGSHRANSLEILGVGAVRFYPGHDFRKQALVITASGGKPMRVRSSVRWSSIELCPGIAFFPRTGQRGSSATQVPCQPRVGESRCLRLVEPVMAHALSLRFSDVIRRLTLYQDANCRSRGEDYAMKPRNRATDVDQIDLTARQKKMIGSMRLRF